MCVQGVGADYGTKSMVLSLGCSGEKEQPEQKSHFLPGAMRKNRRFCLIVGDGVLFVERSSELFACASVSHLTDAQ